MIETMGITMVTSYRLLLLILILSLAGSSGCEDSFSPGTLTNETASPDTFVSEDLVIYAHTDHLTQGLRQIRLDGSERQEILTEEFKFQDVSSDRSVWAVYDDQGKLYLMKDGAGFPSPISDLDFQVVHARISPDMQTIAAVRPRRLTGEENDQSWEGDDTIYLVDVETLEVDIREPDYDDIEVSRLRWSNDGDAIYYLVQPGRIAIRLDVESNERVELAESWEELSEEFFRTPVRSPTSCPHDSRQLEHFTDGDTEGIKISGDGPDRVLISYEDFNYPRHYNEGKIIGSYHFSESCDYVVFSFDDSIWVVEVRSGIAGRLMQGYMPFMLH